MAIAASLHLVRTVRRLGPAFADGLRSVAGAAAVTALALADSLGRLVRGILGA